MSAPCPDLPTHTHTHTHTRARENGKQQTENETDYPNVDKQTSSMNDQ